MPYLVWTYPVKRYSWYLQLWWLQFSQRSVFNPLQPGVAFLYPPENIRKLLGFLIFSRGAEKQQQAVMG